METVWLPNSSWGTRTVDVEVAVNGGGRSRNGPDINAADFHYRHGGEGWEIHASDGDVLAGRYAVRTQSHHGARGFVSSLGSHALEDSQPTMASMLCFAPILA